MRVTAKDTCSKCNGPLEENRKGKQRYCLACHNAHGRANRKDYAKDSLEEQVRNRCRKITARAIHRGEIIRMPCEVCGETRSEVHHADYTKPRLIKWLCKTHHIVQHKADASLGIKHNTDGKMELKKKGRPKGDRVLCTKCNMPKEEHRQKAQAYCLPCMKDYMRNYRKLKTVCK